MRYIFLIGLGIAALQVNQACGETQELPESALNAINEYIFSHPDDPRLPHMSAFASLNASAAAPYTLGWPIDGLGDSGDPIWEVPLEEAWTYVTAVYWHNPTNVRTRSIIHGPPVPDNMQSPAIILPDDIDLLTLTVSMPANAEATVRKQIPAETLVGRRIVVHPAIRPYFALPEFCELGSWIWPCYIMADDNAVFGVYWVNAASGAVRPILVAPVEP